MKRAMKNKLLAYGVLPVMAFALLGVENASAHSMWRNKKINPEELAEHQQTMFNEQAALLGISVEEVKNAWADGKNLLELAQERGITKEQLQQKMIEKHKQQFQDQLKTLVEKGVITQTQAEQRNAFMNKQMENKKVGKKGLNHHGFGRMLGF